MNLEVENPPCVAKGFTDGLVVINSHPENMTVQLGHPFTLRCKFRNAASCCKWKQNGQLIPAAEYNQACGNTFCEITVTNTKTPANNSWQCTFPGSSEGDEEISSYIAWVAIGPQKNVTGKK